MLGDVGQPQFVDVIGGEVPLHEIVMDRRPGTFPVLAAILPEHGPPLVVPADAPCRALAHHFAGLGGFVIYGRDIVSAAQVRELTAAMRAENLRHGTTGILVFESGFVGILGPMQEEARRSAAARMSESVDSVPIALPSNTTSPPAGREICWANRCLCNAAHACGMSSCTAG